MTVLALSATTVPAQEPPAPRQLKIRIVEGEDSVNNPRLRVVREPIVQVENENRKPVAGAIVVFFLPIQGAGASFPGGAASLTAVTDEAGLAVARGLTANGLEGTYRLRVTASYRSATGSADFKMSNSGPVTGVSPGLILTLVAAGAGAAVVGILLANRDRGPGNVTVGPPVVGPPR